MNGSRKAQVSGKLRKKDWGVGLKNLNEVDSSTGKKINPLKLSSDEKSKKNKSISNDNKVNNNIPSKINSSTYENKSLEAGENRIGIEILEIKGETFVEDVGDDTFCGDDDFEECVDEDEMENDDGDGFNFRDDTMDLVDLIRSNDLESLKEGFEKFGLQRSAELCVNSDKRGLSPLTLAAELNYLEAVQIMLELNPDLDVPNEVGGWTALHCASSQGHVEMVQLLVSAGAKLETGDREGWTALHFSCDKGSLEAVAILLNAGADVNACTTAENFTSLYLACQAGHFEVAELLLSWKANIELRDKDGWTPLHAACDKNHLHVTKILINYIQKMNSSVQDAGSLKLRFVNAKTNDGITAIYLAAQYGFAEVVEHLIDNDAEINSVEDEGFAPIHVACQGGHLGTVSAIVHRLKTSVDLAAGNATAWCPLHFATQGGHADILQFLIEKGAKVNITSSEGHTPLHLASENGHLECARILLEKGHADPTVADLLGWCPLHHAVQNGHFDLVVELLKTQTFPGNCEQIKSELDKQCCAVSSVQTEETKPVKIIDLKTKEGDTSLLIAIFNKHRTIVELLMDNGAVINDEDESHLLTLSALHAACEVGDEHLIRLLVHKGANVNATDDRGWTPLHCLAEADLINCIDALLGTQTTGNLIELENPALNGVNSQSKKSEKIAQNELENSAEQDEGFTPSPVFPSPYLSNMSHLNGFSDSEAIFTGDEKLPTVSQTETDSRTVNVSAQCNNGHTPLFLAAHCGNVKTVKHLLKIGAKVDVVDDRGWTALHAASAKGYMDVIRILLTSSGLDANQRTYHGFTALYLAVQELHKEAVELLLNEALVDPNISENQGFCPLHVAAQNGQASIVEILMSSGALGNKSDSNGWTALHFAVQNCHLETVRKLVEHGSDVDAQTNDGVTSLLVAVHKNSDDIIEFLLQHGARTNLSETATGLTPLHAACERGYLKTVQRLLSAGANVEAETKYDNLRPLYIVSRSTAITDESVVETIVRALLSEGADPMPPTNSGLSALHIAAQRGMTGVVQALAEHGALVDVADEAGWTPLMFASRYGQSKTVRALLAAGAKPDNTEADKNVEKVDALLLAVQNGHINVVEILILWSCNINSTTYDGTTALYCASQHGDLEMLQMLLFNGADPNLQDNQGFIPLHPACLNGHKKVAESLVKAGSEVDHSAKDGTRPVQLADKNGHEEIVEWLVFQKGAKQPDYEERFGLGWGTNLVSSWGNYIKNVLAKAYKHGLEEYAHLDSDDDDGNNAPAAGQVLKKKNENFEREATIEKVNVAEAGKNLGRKSRQKSFVAGVARQVHRV